MSLFEGSPYGAYWKEGGGRTAVLALTQSCNLFPLYYCWRLHFEREALRTRLGLCPVIITVASYYPAAAFCSHFAIWTVDSRGFMMIYICFRRYFATASNCWYGSSFTSSSRACGSSIAMDLVCLQPLGVKLLRCDYFSYWYTIFTHCHSVDLHCKYIRLLQMIVRIGCKTVAMQ